MKFDATYTAISKLHTQLHTSDSATDIAKSCPCHKWDDNFIIHKYRDNV